MDETKWKIGDVLKQLDTQMRENLNKAGMDLKGAVQRNIGVDAPKPRKPRYSGVFPHKDNGDLIRSIDYKVMKYNKKGYRKAFVLVVGAHTEYAAALEFGHPINGSFFPFLLPTLKKERLKTIATLSRKLV